MSATSSQSVEPAKRGAVRPTRLLIVIVNYRAEDLCVDCLRSLEGEVASNEGVGVIVCENGTGEEAVRTLRDAVASNGWGDWCEVWAHTPNVGFSGGNDVVLDEVVTWENAPEAVLLLNADTIVREGAIGELLRASDAHPEAGIVSPRLEWPDGTPQVSCFRDFHPFTELEKAAGIGPVTKVFGRYVTSMPLSDEPTNPEWTSFACALIRTEVLRAVGTLDKGYFLYFDDPDYCRMARDAGYRVLNVPSARVVHLRGKSNPSKQLAKEKKRRPWYHYASRARYYAKHHGRLGLFFANILWELGYCVALLRRLVGGKRPPACEGEWRDIWINFSRPMVMPERGQDG